MALETLRGVKQVGTEKIGHIVTMGGGGFEDLDAQTFIVVNHLNNNISFNIQDGPIKENGKNGCQVVDMIRVARHIIANLNEKYPCHENTKTLDALAEALEWQDKRTRDREARGVEGHSKK